MPGIFGLRSFSFEPDLTIFVKLVSVQYPQLKFTVSNFSELDLPILVQLVKDPFSSQVYGETTDGPSLK